MTEFSMDAASTHDLLLAMAGRVDDDLLTWARELVAVGEDGRAIELVSAALIADQVQLPAPVRAALVTAGKAGRSVLDVDAALPQGQLHRDPGPVHIFYATPPGTAAEPIIAALSELLDSQPVDCQIWLSWRLTPAGTAPGPLPHPVVLVELTGDAPTGVDILAYQFATALERAHVPASVEVLRSGAALTDYHATARQAGWLLSVGAACADEESPQRETPALPSLGPISLPETAAMPDATAPDPEPSASVTALPRYRRQPSLAQSLSRFATAAPPAVEPAPVEPIAPPRLAAPGHPEPSPPAPLAPHTALVPTRDSPPAPATTRWEPAEPSTRAPATTWQPPEPLRPASTTTDILDDLLGGVQLEPLLDLTPEPVSALAPSAASSIDATIDRNDPLGLGNLFVSQTAGTGGFDPTPRGVPPYDVPPEPFQEPARNNIPIDTFSEPARDVLSAFRQVALDNPVEPVREIPRYNPLGSMHSLPDDTPADPVADVPRDDSRESAHFLPPKPEPDPDARSGPDRDTRPDATTTPVHGIPQEPPRMPAHRVAQEAAREVAREWDIPRPPGPPRRLNPPVGSPALPPLATPERPMPQRFDPTPATRSGASAAYRPAPRSQPDIEPVTPIHGTVPVAPMDPASPINAVPPINPAPPVDASRLGMRPDSPDRLSPTDRALLGRLQNEMGLHGPGPQSPAPPRRRRPPPNPNPGPARPRRLRTNPPDIAG